MTTTSLEQAILTHLRQLPPEKQQEVLDFVEFLRKKVSPSPPRPIQPSLQQIARLPLSQRHQALAPFIADTATDFQTDPALTEFAVLDSEDWEFPGVEP
ncbi:DUF2281 domain-containing protein [Synechococcus sp. C9]|jgi:hypothetical protein|uniref:DUF2281 domain-containing protein n=1 Tax=Synechococcus sp. C9 TaxID=102119 RepID=UPI001FF1952A|nr:DUF2281 domain-containing protein [Synechococcus sp. C9]